MRIMQKITQGFYCCVAALACASLVLGMVALIFNPLSAQAETAALQHDNNGNITQRTISPTQVTTTYTYDPLNRIKSEAGPAKSQNFDYDEDGNRKSDGAGSYTYESTSNRMATRLGVAVTYDAAGNLTADGTGKTFTYNQADQLYQVKQSGTLLATYTYDGNGLRTRKVTTANAPQSAMTVIYIYDQWGKIMEEYTGNGSLIRSYIWRDDTPVAQIEHSTTSDKILYFEVDHLNTPRAVMDETGKVVWRWESDAFGSTLPNEDPDGDGNKTTVNLRFGGYYADVESGLFYAKNRYYLPMIGRFITSDPIGLRGGINTYSYVEGNPVNNIDPSGLRKIAGNWIGSNWSGGQSGPIIPTNPAPPVGPVDECAMQHDYCYAAVQNSQFQCSANKPPSISDCDAQLARCTLAINSGSLGLAGQILKPLVSTWAIFHGASQR